MATTAPPGTSFIAPEIDERALEVQARARRFGEEARTPVEEEAGRRGGRLDDATVSEIEREAISARLNGGMHSPEHGGQGWTRTEWCLVEEQYGRNTNAIHWHVPNAYN